jgi:BirA family biotin operon repressor/biotin-[acetyl-CoA-carboxylase] ligase
MRLDPVAEAAGARLVVHETIGSTNTEGLRLARAGERGPLWIVARTQTAGRGRRGRAWVSEPGNLHASLLLSNPCQPDRAAELSFVAGLALHDAVSGGVPGLAVRLALKWPNDLLIDRNKFAGILVEGEGTAIVIGIGVNCVRHPAGTAFPATDLATAGVRASAESLLAPLSARMQARLDQWRSGTDFASIRTDWLARAADLGREVRIALADGERVGRFESIDEHGRLVLRGADGQAEIIVSGDVFAPART